MPSTLKQEIEALRLENAELQQLIDDYESRFDAIQCELPRGEGEPDDEVEA
jgi:hypothetical protein